MKCSKVWEEKETWAKRWGSFKVEKEESMQGAVVLGPESRRVEDTGATGNVGQEKDPDAVYQQKAGSRKHSDACAAAKGAAG